MLRACSGKTVLDIEILAVKEGQKPFVEVVELFRIKRTVYRAPPNLVMTSRFIDDELVVGSSAGVMAGLDSYGSQVGNEAFPVLHDLLIQHRGRRCPVDDVCVRDAMLFKTGSPAYVVQFHVATSLKMHIRYRAVKTYCDTVQRPCL